MIYEAAYGEKRDMVVISRNEVSWREDKLPFKIQRARPAPRYPDSPVAPLLVAKQYYDEAICVFMRRLSFRMADTTCLPAMFPRWSPVHQHQIRNIQSLCFTNEYMLLTDAFKACQNLPYLSSLRVHIVHSHALVPRGTKHPELDVYTETDLTRIKGVDALMGIRGLRGFEITSSVSTDTSDGQTCWLNNLRILDNMLRGVVMDARTQYNPRSFPCYYWRRSSNPHCGQTFAAFHCDRRQHSDKAYSVARRVPEVGSGFRASVLHLPESTQLLGDESVRFERWYVQVWSDMPVDLLMLCACSKRCE